MVKDSIRATCSVYTAALRVALGTVGGCGVYCLECGEMKCVASRPSCTVENGRRLGGLSVWGLQFGVDRHSEAVHTVRTAPRSEVGRSHYLSILLAHALFLSLTISLVLSLPLTLCPSLSLTLSLVWVALAPRTATYTLFCAYR